MKKLDYNALISEQKSYPINEIDILINKLLLVQDDFFCNYGVNDIFSNCKFYEIIIANQLNHKPIPGHSGSRDAINKKTGMEYEYKHYKKSSKNHTWTFNDYSDSTIKKLNDCICIFARINECDYKYPGVMDWYYEIEGSEISKYLEIATKKIKNARKMINVSPKQLEAIGAKKVIATIHKGKEYKGEFERQLLNISYISEELEQKTMVKKILTSNKLYELLVALILNHFINPEQGGREGAHDAVDFDMNTYEYKVYQTRNWSFQDISDAVLKKYLKDKKIILAVVDKTTLKVKKIYSVDPNETVLLLQKKLIDKISALTKNGQILRRRQVTLSFLDVKKMKSFEILFEEDIK